MYFVMQAWGHTKLVESLPRDPPGKDAIYVLCPYQPNLFCYSLCPLSFPPVSAVCQGGCRIYFSLCAWHQNFKLNIRINCRFPMMSPPCICSWHSKQKKVIVDNCLRPVTLVKTPSAWVTYMGMLRRSLLNKLHELLHSKGVGRCEFSAISYPISVHLDIWIS